MPGGVYGFVRCVVGNNWQAGGTPTGMLSCFKYIFCTLDTLGPLPKSSDTSEPGQR